GAGHVARYPPRATVARLWGEVCPAAVFEPEVEYAVGGGLIGAVENDQLSPVVVLDVANGEVEDARAGWCGEASCDGPADAECAGGEEPGSESDGSFHEGCSLLGSVASSSPPLLGPVSVCCSPRRCRSAAWSSARSSLVVVKVTRPSIMASRISTILRWSRPSGSSALAARGSAWLRPGRTRVARSQTGSRSAARATVRRRRAWCWARRTTGCAVNPAQRNPKVSSDRGA